jgi:hypothetical protein
MLLPTCVLGTQPHSKAVRLWERQVAVGAENTENVIIRTHVARASVSYA